MQKVAEGQEFGPITDKLIRDLLNAGIRLTAHASENPEEFATRLHAYTVEITTALALAVGKLEAERAESAAAVQKRRPNRAVAGHLSLVRKTPD